LLPTSRIPGPPPLSLIRAIAKQAEFDRDPLAALCHVQSRYGNLARFESPHG
jgi:hypothetical protein